MTHEEQMARLEQARADLMAAYMEAVWKCRMCVGTGVYEGHACQFCAGTGNESRLVEEE